MNNKICKEKKIRCTCGNIFNGAEFGAPETGAAAVPPSTAGLARLAGNCGTGSAISAVCGIPYVKSGTASLTLGLTPD